MASAAIWLEELGIPPREVCLDWAWQIQRRFAEAKRREANATTPLPWQRVEVSDSGELTFPNNYADFSPDALLHELLIWARGNSSFQSLGSSSASIVSELRILTRQCLSSNQCLDDAEASSTSVPLKADALLNLEQEEEPPERSEVLVRPTERKQRLAKNSKSTTKFGLFWQELPKRYKIAGLSIVFVASVCSLVALNSVGPKSTPSKHSSAGQLAKKQVEDGVLPEDLTEAVDNESLAVLPEIPQIAVVESLVPAIPSIDLPSVSSVEAPGDHNARSEISASKNLDPNKASADDPLTPSQVVSSENVDAASESSKAMPSSDRDVMQELGAITKSAEGQAVETEIPAIDGDEKKDNAAPLVLPTSPMVQTQKVASRLKVRPRQPVWEITLAVDDEFELDPREPQSISDRQMTTWLLSDSNAKSPKTRIVIQAQAASGRQTSLRWRIFANAEDLPDLVVPLAKEHLQPLQDRLRWYAQFSQHEVDRLKALMSAAERDVRTALSKQRATMEAQGKLASRLSTVAAEAELLDDLLRGQLTVYAKLRDGLSPDAEVVMQFGDDVPTGAKLNPQKTDE